MSKFPVCANLDELREFIISVKATTKDALKFIKELGGDVEAFGHLSAIYVDLWTINERYVPELERHLEALVRLCAEIER